MSLHPRALFHHREFWALTQTCWRELVIWLHLQRQNWKLSWRSSNKRNTVLDLPLGFGHRKALKLTFVDLMLDKTVILLDQLVGRYGDFTAGFKIGAITDHFMINLLCEVLMDMHHSSLDTINETWLLEWDNVVRARDDTTRLWLGCSSWHLLFSVRAKAKLEALEVADLKKLLGCVYVWSTGWVCYHVRVLQSLKMFLLFIKILSYLG